MDSKPLINRLLSGVVIFKLKGDYIYVRPAKVEDKAFADVYAQEIYEDALLDGIFTIKDTEEFLIEKDWWSEEDDKKLEDLNKNLEQMKVDYYVNFFKDEAGEYIKKSIGRQNKKISDLLDKKHIFFDKTCEYVRDFAKTSIILARSSFFESGDLAVEKIDAHKLINAILKEGLSDKEIRGVAKKSEWRVVWSSKDAISLFGAKGCDLTNEQISLIGWSRFYDGVYESMDKPNDEIIKDDLALDGWSISQDRKRKEEEKKQQGEKLASKAQSAGEVFVPVKNQKEQDQVLSLNDQYGKQVLASKRKQFEEGGVFNETDLKHVKKEIQMESLRQSKESRRR